MKKYGCLLMIGGLFLSLSAFADDTVTFTKCINQPTLVHCAAGTNGGCTTSCEDPTPKKCTTGFLIHCTVGGACTHTCDEAGTPVSANSHTNRKAASTSDN